MIIKHHLIVKNDNVKSPSVETSNVYINLRDTISSIEFGISIIYLPHNVMFYESLVTYVSLIFL